MKVHYYPETDSLYIELHLDRVLPPVRLPTE